jgi:ABC-type glutathione transport system ATPase component
MIFQDPASSLDPRMRARDIILEGFHIKRRKFDGVEEILKRVGLGPDSGSRFPHEFSGGERQRIAIARAMATRPEFIVCDEPVSSLDVSMQEEILNLLKRLQAESDLTYLFISHDLAAVEYMSDDVAVMYQGKIAECGDCRKVCRSPEHPYTKRLIESVLTFSLSPFWGRG